MADHVIMNMVVHALLQEMRELTPRRPGPIIPRLFFTAPPY